MMRISTASTLASWVPVVLRCLKQFGIDEGQSLKRASISPDKLLQAGARYDVLETHRLMDLVNSVPDVSIPDLELAKYTDAHSFGAFGFAMLTTPL